MGLGRILRIDEDLLDRGSTPDSHPEPRLDRRELDPSRGTACLLDDPQDDFRSIGALLCCVYDTYCGIDGGCVASGHFATGTMFRHNSSFTGGFTCLFNIII